MTVYKQSTRITEKKIDEIYVFQHNPRKERMKNVS